MFTELTRYLWILGNCLSLASWQPRTRWAWVSAHFAFAVCTFWMLAMLGETNPRKKNHDSPCAIIRYSEPSKPAKTLEPSLPLALNPVLWPPPGWRRYVYCMYIGIHIWSCTYTVYIYICMYVHLSICLSIYLSIYLSIHPSIYLSI